MPKRWYNPGPVSGAREPFFNRGSR